MNQGIGTTQPTTAMPRNGGTAGGRTAAEFERAARHSKMVRVLKIGMPMLAAAIVVTGLAVTWLARSVPVDIAVAATSIEDGRLVMQDPRMSGSDQNDRPYSLVARRAIQSLTGGGIDLEAIEANLSVDAETTARLAAASGRYDPDAGRLRLFDDISVDTSSGITIRLSSADVSVEEGRLEGTGPVLITTPNQRLESGAVTIEDNGARLSFTNRVKLTLLPTEPAAEGASNPVSE